MPARRYDALSGRVGCCFVHALATEITGFWQHQWQARAKKTTLAENKVMYEDGKGYTGGLPGYITIGEDRQIQEIYRNWVKSNNGAHISGGI